MFHVRHLVAACVLIGTVSVCGVVAQEQPSYEARIIAAKATLQVCEGTVADWERGASFEIAMVVIFAALGAVTMVLQAVKRPWVPIATVVTGALVSSLTVVNTAVSQGDYKTLNKRAGAGRLLLD